MNELAMDQLVEQVPELKLRKRTETRTIHWSDVRENKNLREGDVIPVISWVNDAGTQWTRADIMYYIKLCNAFDTPTEQLLSERKTVKMELVH
jgi:hypothetical protein